MEHKHAGIFRIIMLLFALGIGASIHAQSITLGTPNVGACGLNGSTPTSTISVQVEWTSPPSGELIEVELIGATPISTNPILINPATTASPTTVSFTTVADGSTGATISAEFSAPFSATGTATTTTAAFNVAENTCCPSQTATICTDGTNSVTLTPDAGLTSVVWYFIDASGTETMIPGANYGTNDEIVITANQSPWDTYFSTDGNDQAQFYYTAIDPNTCSGELCCPVTVNTEVCYDLALAKTVNTGVTPGPYAPGDAVQFTIELTNQGTRTAYDISVVDYIPTGLTSVDVLEATASSGVVIDNGGGSFTLDELASGASMTVDISFTIDAAFMGTTILNAAEISGFFKDAAGTVAAADEDSTPDNMNDEDGAGAELTNNDVITDVDDGALQDDDPIEDDYDPEQITINQTFDLALTKVESSTGPYVPGSNTVFTITVYNQGTLDATAINITDYIPTDMSYTATGSTASGALTTVDGATANLTNNGDGTFVLDALGFGDEVSFDIGLMIASDFMGTSITNYAEIVSATNGLGQVDEDDDLATTGPGNAPTETNDDVNDAPDNGADQDDFDPETITVNQTFDLALTKVESSTGPYVPGSNTVFTITVYNQGTLDATAINITDYIPTDMSYTATGSTASGALTTVDGATANLTNNGDGTFVLDALGFGDEVSFDIGLMIASDFMGTSITNYAEIVSATNGLGQVDEDDDLATTGPGNAPTETNDDVNDAPDNGADQDDFDPETITVNQTFDLALTKVESSTGPYVPGSNTVFTITVYNQGTLDATAINITDYIPTDMSYTATGSTASGALTTVDGATANLTNNGDGTFVLDALGFGDEVSFDIGLKIASDFMGTSITNYAEIVSATNGLGQVDEDDDLATTGPGNAPTETNDDVNDSPDNGADQDDFDPETITVNQTFDLALTKVESSTGPYVPGSNTVFTITVYNQGTLDATAINITDYIPTDMSYTAIGSTASGALTTVDGATANLTNNGDGTFVLDALGFGDEVSFDIGLTISSTFLGTSITNYAEIVSATNSLGQVDEDDDLATTGPGNAPTETNDDVNDAPDNGADQDDFDPETINVLQLDYGDLADGANGTASGDYETLSANGGPSHIIVNDLMIGATVDNEVDGQQSANADGDDTNGDDEDGVDLAGISFRAGNDVAIPVTVTNNTGGDATLYAFIDWNNDGDFGDTGEEVLVTISSAAGSQTVLVNFTIPTEAAGTDINSTVGARFRLTTDTLPANAWEGPATDGEVEDYVLQVSCPTGNCFGVQIDVEDN